MQRVSGILYVKEMGVGSYGIRPVLMLSNDVYTDLALELRGEEPYSLGTLWGHLHGTHGTFEGRMSAGFFMIYNIISEDAAV